MNGVLFDPIYPDRKAQIMGLVENSNHKRLYQFKMTPEELVFFNIFDNRGLSSIAQSPLDLVEAPDITSVRKGMESRTLVRYEAEKTDAGRNAGKWVFPDQQCLQTRI